MAGREQAGAGDVRRDRAPRPLPAQSVQKVFRDSMKKTKTKKTRNRGPEGGCISAWVTKAESAFLGDRSGAGVATGLRGQASPRGTASGESIGAQALEALVRCHSRTGRCWGHAL